MQLRQERDSVTLTFKNSSLKTSLAFKRWWKVKYLCLKTVCRECAQLFRSARKYC